jgi:deoxyribonuclease-4
MLKIGSHVSFSEKGLLSAAKEAGSYGASTFMIYTGAPQNTRRKPMETHYIEEGKQLMAELGIDEIVVHAPYIINLGSYKEDTYQLAVDFLQSEIDRTAYIGVKNIVLHPGAYTDKDAAYGIQRIADGLNEVLQNTQGVNIALETMAGKGSEIGRSFEELAAIIDKVTHNERLTICLDTCHVHDAGYNIVDDLDGVLTHFDRVIGLNRLAVVHLNDSKNPRGAAKDRHAPIGAGYIGSRAMQAVVAHEALRHLPMVLETPWIGRDDAKARPMYEAEIALLSGRLTERFGAGFLEDTARLAHFFAKQDIEPRAYVLDVWNSLKGPEALASKGKGKASKDKTADKREPMERLYELIESAGVLPHCTEEQINHRLTAWLAGEGRD